MANWKKRYFVLNQSSICYFDDKTLSTKKGEIRFFKTSYVERIPEFEDIHKHLLCFYCNDLSDKSELLMNASSLEGLGEWEAAFNFAITTLQQDGGISTTQTTETSQSISIPWPPSFVKSGILFKQRDVLKGWRSKHFVLNNYFLHYFNNAEEALVPKKSLFLADCSVVSIRAIKVGDIEYFPFLLTNSKSIKTYNFATTSEEETNSWITVLTQICQQVNNTKLGKEDINRLRDRKTPSAEQCSTDPSEMVNHQSTMDNVSESYSLKNNFACKVVADNLREQSVSQWELLYEQEGLVVHKKAGFGDCVRGAK